MATHFHPSPILYPFTFLLIIIISSIPQSFSQQNIQTFYPSVILPPPPPVNEPPPTTPLPPPPSLPSRSPSTRAAVGRAIGATAATTLVLSGLLFFLLLRRSRRKRERENSVISNGRTNYNNSNNNPPILANDNFKRFNGNLKGVIVDENGLDVLYWRNLEDGDGRGSFKKQNYQSLRDEQKEEEKRIVNERSRRSPPVQEAPLLRGKSSTSQSPVWRENGDQIINRAPTFSFGADSIKENRDSSEIQIIKIPKQTLPPPPGAPPPPPPLVSTAAVPTEKPAPVAAVPRPNTASPPPQPPVPAMNSLVPPPPPRVPAKNGLVPPPPPPVPAKKGPGPPPPPPPGGSSVLKPPAPGKRSSSVGEGTSSKENGQVKLKPLHWDKVNPNVEHSMVWDKIDKGSFKFDGDLMEALFGYVATNRKSPQRDNRSTSPRGEKPGPRSQIFILDTRKSQNTAIVLKSLGLSRREIIDALINGRGLNADVIEKLTRIAPNDEEASEILAFDGDPTRLADAESFLYHLLKSVPSAFTRFNAMLFRSNYNSEVSNIKDSLQSLDSACKELRTRGLFLKLLEAVLKAGNRLNAGTSRGNAQAFNLMALRKLSDVKSSDGKTTLLQFVVQEVIRAEGKRCVLNRNRSLSRISSQSSNEGGSIQSSDTKDDREREYMMLGLPVIGGLSAEFTNVKKAATLDFDLILKTGSTLSKQVDEIRKVVEQCGTEGGFAREMRGFLETACLEIEVLREEQTSVMELVKKTTDYYQAGSYRDKGANPLQLFIIVRDFLGMVDQVCVDIARNVQRRKALSSVAGSSSSPSDSPRVFRFPKLPPNFMSESSKSGSSDSDDESEELR